MVMIRILSKARKLVPIGYTTHNGEDYRCMYVDGRALAKEVCEFANAHGRNDRERIKSAWEFLISRGV